MPCLNISTNVSLDGINTSAILSEASSQVAKIIGKPESCDLAAVLCSLWTGIVFCTPATMQTSLFQYFVLFMFMLFVPPSKSSFSPELLSDLTP
ncbi:TAUTOMERASE/MIF SUPERFAMILY PROTEIN [Salix koriyanagi]|uniref:TAUTOMERASE/MIF SUPERFAMILY PROTEIN n=1 Tax=Salix koriyanagi TaxID=2511006 RepID=A0A9Q0VE89_9ROSI|nr:TAUTOMERASE/MIF SUPERFAMILY PROTEIN [Salix koriyanagi]